MTRSPEAAKTFGLRAIDGGTDLTSRMLLDFDQRLFRRNYRQPVIVSAALSGGPADLGRWIAADLAPLAGYDVAARVLNRVTAEAAEPLFLRSIITGGDEPLRSSLRRGLAEACNEADCNYFNDAGNPVGELAVAVVAVGVVERARLMDRRRFCAGDAVIAVGSDRLWAPLDDRVRSLMASATPPAKLPALMPGVHAWAQPAPVLAAPLATVLRRYTVKRVVHAMVPVEGDGLAPALARLVAGRFEVRPARGERIFSKLLAALAGQGLVFDGADEAHARGLGLLLVVSEPFAAAVARRLRGRRLAACQFGKLAVPGAE